MSTKKYKAGTKIYNSSGRETIAKAGVSYGGFSTTSPKASSSSSSSSKSSSSSSSSNAATLAALQKELAAKQAELVKVQAADAAKKVASSTPAKVTTPAPSSNAATLASLNAQLAAKQAELKAKLEEENTAKTNAEKKAALEKELVAKQAELKAKLEEENTAKTNAEKKVALEKELVAKQAELKAKLEEDAKIKSDAELKAKEEEARIKDKKDETPEPTPYDDSGLINSDEYKRLPKDQQEVVREIMKVVSNNDQVKAKRLIDSFKAMQKINDPYFAQQLGLATDAIERGYVSIDKQAEFEEKQMRTRLTDLKTDYESKKAYMTLEQAQTMKDIQTGYEQNLEGLQTGLAESGFTSSSRRVQKEKILNDATGDLRESKNRAFSYETNALDETKTRGERDTASEIARLAEITKSGKLDFLRKAETSIGSEALGKLSLNGGEPLVGGIYGDINEKKLQDTISSMSSFVF